MTSFIHMKKGDFFFHTDGWTTTPPTKEGLYWAKTKHGIRSFDIESSYNGKLYYSDWLLQEAIGRYDITHWLGPLPVPELPE